MNQTLQQAAKDYAEEVYHNSSEIEEYGLANAFEEGAEWQQKQSPWINAKDAMPKAGETVVWLIVDNSEGFLGELDTDDNERLIKYDALEGEFINLKDCGDLWWVPMPKLDEKDCGSKEL